MATVDLIARLTAQGEAQFVGALGSADSAMSGLGRTAVNAAQNLGRLFAGGIVAGATAFGVALGAGAYEGLRFNNSMEQVSAQLMAFLKDGDAVDATLAMITERAAATPFAFEDMAKAATGLIPAATQANVPLEELIATAEILAASNPAEGLEGAAFALREAVSGDFTSIIERFNLPRSYINQLKEDGVPALEAVTMAMAQLGLDTDLVSNLAQTAEGRWSTIKDTFTGIAAQLTKPIFDFVSASMGRFLEKMEKAKPYIDGIVDALSWAVSSFITNVENGMSPLDAFINSIQKLAPQGVVDFFVNLRDNILPTLVEAFYTFSDWFTRNKETIIDVVSSIAAGFAAFSIISTVAGWIGALVAAWGAVSAAVATSGGVISAIVAFLGGPLTVIIGVIAAAVALFAYAWTQNWGGIQEKTAVAIEYVKTVIANGLAAIQAWWAENGDAIIAKALEIWTLVSGHISTGIENAKIIISTALAFIRQWWAENGDAIMAKALEIWTMVSTHISTGIENAKEIISEALAVIKAWWAENGDEIMAKALEIWTAVKDHINTGIENAKTIISEALAVIKAWWAENGDEITAKALEIWTAVKDHISTGIENAKEIISTALATILAWWDENGEKVTATVEAIWDGIKNAYKTASAFVLGIIASALAAIGGDWETAGEAWNTVVKDAWEKLKAAFVKGLEIIGNAVGDAWPRIKQAFSDGIEVIKTTFSSVDWGALGTAIIEGVANAISAGIGIVQDAAKAMAQAALDAAKSLLGIQSPSRMFYEIGENVAQGFINALGDNEGNVSAAVDNMLAITSSLSSIGSTISGVYEKREIAPLEDALKAIKENLPKDKEIERLATALGLTVSQFEAMSSADIAYLGGAEIMASNEDFAAAQHYIQLLEERKRLQDELYDKTQAMLELEKQQQDLALLKAQQDLLNLIRDNNLSASILDGLELGLDADLGAIMAAMSAAMQEMLAAAQTELGIASPSKEFYRIGQQVTAGLANALWAGEGMISNAMTDLVTVPSMANMSAASLPTYTNSTADATGGFASQTINITVKIEGGTTDQRTAAQRGVDEALQAAGINADIRRRM